MLLDRPGMDEQQASDLAVSEAARDQGEHLPFPIGESAHRGIGARVGSCPEPGVVERGRQVGLQQVRGSDVAVGEVAAPPVEADATHPTGRGDDRERDLVVGLQRLEHLPPQVQSAQLRQRHEVRHPSRTRVAGGGVVGNQRMLVL